MEALKVTSINQKAFEMTNAFELDMLANLIFCPNLISLKHSFFIVSAT